MPMCMDYTLLPPRDAVPIKRKRVPSVRVSPTHPEDEIQVWKDKPFFPFVRVGYEPDPEIAERVASVVVLWQLRHDDGSPAERCERCAPAPVNMLQFRQRRVFKKIYEHGRPMGGFLGPEHIGGAMDGLARGGAIAAMSDTATHGVVQYGELERGNNGGGNDAGPEWASTFKVVIVCNSHFHEGRRFRLFTQSVAMDAAGTVLGHDASVSASLHVVSKFLDPINPEPDDPSAFPPCVHVELPQDMLLAVDDKHAGGGGDACGGYGRSGQRASKHGACRKRSRSPGMPSLDGLLSMDDDDVVAACAVDDAAADVSTPSPEKRTKLLSGRGAGRWGISSDPMMGSGGGPLDPLDWGVVELDDLVDWLQDPRGQEEQVAARVPGERSPLETIVDSFDALDRLDQLMILDVLSTRVSRVV